FHPIYRAFPKMPLVSISDDQRGPMPPSLNWMATIDHGLPATLYRFNQKGGSYLAFLGRIAPEKRPDRAIEIAKRAGIPLKIAAKVDPADQEYFAHVIEPLLHDPLVEFIGEIGDQEKTEFLGNARALLFPIDWPEPFGLVMIEAMATGTPVIAWRKGSVPKVVDEGVTGFVVDSIEDAVRAVGQIGVLDRTAVRQQFEARFTSSQMATKYLAVYKELVAGSQRKKLAKSVPVEKWMSIVDDHPLQPLPVNGL
ncbi:MAG: glycosyltransferase family 4 protein, partial [Pseudolabrys sp.]